MTQVTSYVAVVPAAGVGKRMQADRPKQYLTIDGKTILQRTLETLISHPRIRHVVVALDPQDPYFLDLPISGEPWLTRVDGGKERADSVLAGLAAVRDSEWVLVHDAARPCVSHEDVSALLALADVGDVGGILAAPVRDTMKRAKSDDTLAISHTESRDNLWHALTPQFFQYQQLQTALADGLRKGAQITDEASAIELAGGQVTIVPGSDKNIKITRPDDLALAAFYLRNRTSQCE